MSCHPISSTIKKRILGCLVADKDTIGCNNEKKEIPVQAKLLNFIVSHFLDFNLEVPNSKQTLLFLKTYHCSEHRMIYENM